MTTLVIGSGLIGSQIARILVEQGERPVLMDRAHQEDALREIVNIERVVLAPADVLQPLELTLLLREHAIDVIVHTAANRDALPNRGPSQRCLILCSKRPVLDRKSPFGVDLALPMPTFERPARSP